MISTSSALSLSMMPISVSLSEVSLALGTAVGPRLHQCLQQRSFCRRLGLASAEEVITEEEKRDSKNIATPAKHAVNSHQNKENVNQKDGQVNQDRNGKKFTVSMI